MASAAHVEHRAEDDDDRVARALARRSWPVARVGPRAPPPAAAPAATPLERLCVVWPLTLDAWAMSGWPVADLPRERWQVRRVPRSIARSAE
jgi:hypothetical protein